MPEIRSITYFTNVFAEDSETPLARAGTFLSASSYEFEQAGITVQSRRVATQPFPQHLTPRGPITLPRTAGLLLELCEAFGINYLSIGPVGALDDPLYIDALAEVFAAAPGIFASVNIADKTNGIQPEVVHRTAQLIDKVSRITPDGMTNLYLAALANCPPWSPFFPAAYHALNGNAFALAIQAADLAITAFENATSIEEASQNLQTAVEAYAQQVVPIAEKLGEEHGAVFKGLDFSLAPYPTDDKSLGGALEKLGTPIGQPGLVASAALLMSALDAADFPSTGFSGLMLPILEDSILGQRVLEDRLRLNDLLLLSAICGTGLDCIPLPGDVGVDYLYAILLDVAALALRLNKPLTARLMPFPGKKGGDPLTFDFEYFTDSKVIATDASQLSAAWANKTGLLSVRPLHD